MRPLLFWLVCVAAACGGAAPSSRTAAGGSWSEVRVSWDYGPCPGDGPSCHQTLTVHSDGGFIAEERSNAGGDPERRFSALTSTEIRDVHRIIDAPGFLDKLGSFACAPEADATVRIEVEGPSGVRSQEVGGCVHSPEAPTAPKSLVELLARHRHVDHVGPVTVPPGPGGQGDACGPTTGCARGFVCAIAPCVVAPCVNGTCQSVH